MKALIALFALFFSVNVFAGDCYCKDKTGSSKRACKNTPSECNSFCQEMNPVNLPDWMVTITYSPGSCNTLPAEAKYFQALARPANNWNDTGKDIQAGEVYIITVQVSSDISASWHSNPYWQGNFGEGNSNYIAGPSYLLPGKPEGSLIGRVGDGPVFYIGNNGKTPENSVGRLRVTVNDAPAGFGDNSGWLMLEIKRQ